MKPLKRFNCACALLLMAVAAFAQSPNTVVEDAIEILDKALSERRDELSSDSDALYALIDDVLLPRFDRKYAAQLVLGKYWRTATAEQRVDFTEAFYASLRKRYADGVLEFKQSSVDVLAYRGDDSKKRTVAKTIVLLDDGTKVPVNYGLVKRESGWLIFDVTIEGISYIRNFRAELNSEIRTTSLDAVIARLRRELAGDSE